MVEAIKTPMTEEEKRAALTLSHCTFYPASWNKRFAHDMAFFAKEDRPITENQRFWLWKLVYRYRRQIKDLDILSIAQEKVDGQTSLFFKERDTTRQKVHKVSRIRHKITDFIEQELFNGAPEDHF
ncbi:MAG TPA: hypothetical protein VHO03_05770 [Ignavibacteriales bacterium]|nr:hypothetical protein [Ignavibacteriales bacterium]